MTTDAMPESDPAPPADTDKPITRRFRSRSATPRLPADVADRQGRIASLAWAKLGGRDAAISFLNTHDDALGGRPLDIAVASSDGFDTIAQAIAERAGTA